MTTAVSGRATATPAAILAIILISYFMILLDNSVIFTGLPSIRSEPRPDADGAVVGPGRLHPGLRWSAAARLPAPATSWAGADSS